jgi:hypothetical protein
VLRVVLGGLGPGLLLVSLSLACGPSAAPAAPSPSADAFAVVRATSQSAYLAGQTAVAQGDYLQACVDFDAAKTNDPDNRPEIQQALDQALSRCLTPPPAQATTAPAAAQQRTIVVATISAAVSGSLSGSPSAVAAAATTVVDAAPPLGLTPPAVPAIAVSALPTLASSAAPTATPVPAGSNSLVAWNDPQGRFSISAPSDWGMTNPPQSLVGSAVVEFHDPSGIAEVDVAVDDKAKAVSPELYAATLELAMQQQVPGYASEQVIPGTTAGSPSVQRVFTFTQRDAAGQQHQARGMQLTIVKGSTPYIISASTPAEQYAQFSPTFDRIVGSFRFS